MHQQARCVVCFFYTFSVPICRPTATYRILVILIPPAAICHRSLLLLPPMTGREGEPGRASLLDRRITISIRVRGRGISRKGCSICVYLSRIFCSVVPRLADRPTERFVILAAAPPLYCVVVVVLPPLKKTGPACCQFPVILTKTTDKS